MDGWTDGRTDGRMDIPSFRDARTHLKIEDPLFCFPLQRILCKLTPRIFFNFCRLDMMHGARDFNVLVIETKVTFPTRTDLST